MVNNDGEHVPVRPSKSNSSFSATRAESSKPGRKLTPAEKIERIIAENPDIGDMEAANTLVARSRRLEEDFKTIAANFRSRLCDSRFEHAQNRVAAWKADVRALSTHFEAQLHFCRSLRNSKVLKSLLEQSEGSASEKLIAQAVETIEQLSHDARVLKRFSEAGNQSDTVSQVGRYKGNAKVGEVAWKQMEIDEGQKSTVVWQVLESLVNCINEYKQRQSQLCQRALEFKKELEDNLSSSSGATLDFSHLNESANLQSQATSSSTLDFVEVLDSSISLTQIFALIQSQGNLESISLAAQVHEISSKKNSLEKTVVTMKKEVEVMEKVIAAQRQLLVQNEVAEDGSSNEYLAPLNAKEPQLQNSTTGAKRQSGNYYLAAMQLEECNLERHRLQAENLKFAEQAKNHKLELECQQEIIKQLESKLLKQAAIETADVLWLAPRIERLQETIESTSDAFKAMVLDVELLSGMFHASVQKCKKLEVKVKSVDADRSLLGEKLSKTIKATTLLKSEEARLQNVIQLMVASRESLITQNQERCRELGDIKDRMSGLRYNLDEKDSKIETLEKEVKKLQGLLKTEKTKRKQCQQEVEKLQQDIQEAWDKVVEHNLDKADILQQDDLDQ